MLRSWAGLMKSCSRAKPGTGVSLRVKACPDFALSPDRVTNTACSGDEQSLMGLKKSLIAFRFLLGCSMAQG